jgi:predicted phage tail protein
VVVACAPQAPGPLTSEVSGGSVSLSWVPSQSPAIRYVVVAGSGPMRGDIAQIYVGAATSLHAVAPPGRYFVRVRAVSSCGGFAESNEVEVAVGLPVAPANLVAAVNGNSVSLTWNAPAGTITGYVLEAGSGTGLSNLASLRLGPASSYRVSGVPVGTYYVRVRAFNLAGLSPPSNELRLTVP